ncbi:MAG TPA: adenylosuccinate lyase [Solirubrobacteraceae bacterium]|nr:adenylosuccinate lyase [Solirubrobacteraceae bacterium]
MIPRYTRPELGALWTDEARMEAWRRVEVAACEELPGLLDGAGAQSGPRGDAKTALGETAAAHGPNPPELEAIRRATFSVEAVNERERTTDHDVAAFVDVLSASAGEAGRWIHFGLTSSDVLDTALALQLRAAGEQIVAGARALVQALANRAREHVDTLCVGRTHGVHAEPTTFGVKLAGFAFEAHRNALRLERAFEQAAVGAISGAVGTYAATSPEFERRVLERLGLRREEVSTQVVARDRHAELLAAIALAGAGIERLATEIRHLQRTEVREAQEPFKAGQKGSSAMPHKRNPIKSEQLSGLARLLRGNAQAALENVALWHERDISHSSVERVILPDSTILIDHMQHAATRLVQGLLVDERRMRENLELTHGALFSQRVLLALVEGDEAPEGVVRGEGEAGGRGSAVGGHADGRGGAPMSRDDAYRIAQELAQRAWDEGTPLRELLAADERTAGLDLDAIFDYGHYTRYAHEIVARLDEIA